MRGTPCVLLFVNRFDYTAMFSSHVSLPAMGIGEIWQRHGRLLLLPGLLAPGKCSTIPVLTKLHHICSIRCLDT